LGGGEGMAAHVRRPGPGGRRAEHVHGATQAAAAGDVETCDGELAALEARLQAHLDAGRARPIGKAALLAGGHVATSSSVAAQLDLFRKHGGKTRPRHGWDERLD
jgi:hypothetical protein